MGLAFGFLLFSRILVVYLYGSNFDDFLAQLVLIDVRGFF